MLDKIKQSEEKQIYSFVAGAFFMSASLLLPISFVYSNLYLGFSGVLCLLLSLYYVNLFAK